MTDTSINGWPVIGTQTDPRLKVYQIAGSTRKLRVATDAAPILLWAAARFHRTVANLDKDPLAVWGYNKRPARQSTQWSDHASGSAIDLRSDKFPVGTRNMTVLQKLAVRRILNATDGILIWGGDYKTDASADQMHFAIAPGKTAAHIKAWQIKNRIDNNGRSIPK